MILKTIVLQNFRNYPKATFIFDPQITIIIGQNAVGKTNLIEAVFLLATGKSFRASPPAGGEKQLIAFGKQVYRVKGSVIKEDEDMELEVVSSQAEHLLKKKYLVNGISKRRVNFAGNLPVVLFTPTDLDIVTGQPASRRRYLDEILEQVDFDYRVALGIYSKALRQRNALLVNVQETGYRNEKRFAYWDELLIANGKIVTKKREELIEYINRRKKDFFAFTLLYDKSIMSAERLAQYKGAEVGAGVTLVGPQRDDVVIKAYHDISQELEDVKHFSSRGQQRLIVLELKESQISFIQESSQERPVLLLDDIFSELDSGNIAKILRLMQNHQTIITTTHKEFVSKNMPEKHGMIELSK